MTTERDSEQKEAGAATLEKEKESLFQLVKNMTVTEKMRFALRCSKEGRTLLSHDPNRGVQLALISNPHITEAEVVIIAWSRESDQDVLRRISENHEWVKHYPVRLGLAWNPKTPLLLVTRLLGTLMREDLSKIAKSKDVPVTVAHAARRLILRKG